METKNYLSQRFTFYVILQFSWRIEIVHGNIDPLVDLTHDEAIPAVSHLFS
jgi:hypothetical protein